MKVEVRYRMGSKSNSENLRTAPSQVASVFNKRYHFVGMDEELRSAREDLASQTYLRELEALQDSMSTIQMEQQFRSSVPEPLIALLMGTHDRLGKGTDINKVSVSAASTVQCFHVNLVESQVVFVCPEGVFFFVGAAARCAYTRDFEVA